jgi:hypothetical protein
MAYVDQPHQHVASHQTVRLSRGSHRSPDDGVCAMELASMLAGERFSDHPRSVCPVIGAFLRAYNDRVDDDRRQDLYVYAAEVVGTRGDRGVRQERMTLCHRFAERVLGAAPVSPPRLFWLVQTEPIARRAAVAAADAPQPRGHSMALALLDALIALGSPGRVAAVTAEAEMGERAGGAVERR